MTVDSGADTKQADELESLEALAVCQGNMAAILKIDRVRELEDCYTAYRAQRISSIEDDCVQWEHSNALLNVLRAALTPTHE